MSTLLNNGTAFKPPKNRANNDKKSMLNNFHLKSATMSYV